MAPTPSLGNVWNDTWVPSLGPLRPWLRVWSHAIANLELNDLLQHDRQWDVSRLSNLLLPEAVPFIIGIPPPNLDVCDAFAWNSTSSGIFSVASAYAHLLEPTWDIIDPKWSWVWSLAVTPRIRMFIWLVLKRRLMTNEERTRRGLTSDASCPCCGCISESIAHILRDCPSTRALWCSILPPDRHALFFSSSLEHWVVSNIRSKLRFSDSSTPWACFFPTLLWQLWKRRNDFVFTDVCLPLEAVYNLSRAWAKHFVGNTDMVRVPASPLVSLLQWTPPATGWGHRLPLVYAIESLCQDSSQVDLRWIPRELNMVADCLLKLPSLPQFELSVISDIPESVRPLLDRDKDGPPYSRRGRGVT
ncbi:hypothetical protein V6N11_066594 [Hibiscus sabdariffa]|uniref:Reverse transcriptase zinc-binding domain-containing protein n=1 Tax=Hibiscus sabdariffa TaxID=183260 RepID=A0ABR1Z9A4_9ROSI